MIHFREARIEDIPGMMIVRFAVRENRLNNPSLVTEADCADYITRRGKGWVCEMEDRIIGFAIADLVDHNIWALFVVPEMEGEGIGKTLHKKMMDWYFSKTNQAVWLTTDPRSRAAYFYRKLGWEEKGIVSNGELRFEMNAQAWQSLSS